MFFQQFLFDTTSVMQLLKKHPMLSSLVTHISIWLHSRLILDMICVIYLLASAGYSSRFSLYYPYQTVHQLYPLLHSLTILADMLVIAPKCLLSSRDFLTFAFHHLVYSSFTCLEKKTNISSSHAVISCDTYCNMVS